MAQYIAYNYNKMNQSFIMKNENKQSVFEANLIKFRLLRACDYEFVDKINLRTEAHKVGKTITKEQGVGGVSFTTSSYFKLDGVKVFDLLDEKGYFFKIALKLDIVHPEFALMDKNNNQVALYKMNVLAEREENVKAIGKKQRNIVITTESEDLYTVFLGAFILSRVDFSTYLV